MVPWNARHGRRRLSAHVLLWLVGCSPGLPPTGPGPAALASAESLYADLRELRDRYEVTIAAGRAATQEGVPLAELTARHDALREQVGARLAAIDSARLGEADGRALGIMRKALARELTPIPAVAASSAEIR